MRYAILLILALVTASFVAGNRPAYIEVAANNGDGAYSILRRYHLLEYPGNVAHFYEINGLAMKASLAEGKRYKIPVLEYAYDGSSIASTVGVDDQQKARTIEAYNDKLLESKIVKTHYSESGKVWVPTLVIKSDGTLLAPGSAGEASIKSVPLFGRDYSAVQLKSQKLSGQVFYVISGHGGPDPGALAEVGNSTICEDEYAYDVSLRLARNLMEHGARVEVIVQDPDDGIRDGRLLLCDKSELSMGRTKIPMRQLERLRQRTHEVNKLHKAHKKKGYSKHTVVCVHVDSRGPSKRQDVFFYYYEPSKAGRELANNLQATFKEKYSEFRPARGYQGTVSSRGLYMLRNTNPPAVYVELANIQNSADLKRILPSSNRQALANWLFEGLTQIK